MFVNLSGNFNRVDREANRWNLKKTRRVWKTHETENTFKDPRSILQHLVNPPKALLQLKTKHPRKEWVIYIV